MCFNFPSFLKTEMVQNIEIYPLVTYEMLKLHIQYNGCRWFGDVWDQDIGR